MDEITTDDVTRAIHNFLDSRIQRDGEKIFKALEKLDREKDIATIAELNESLVPIREKYRLENWMPKAIKMAGELRFGTHISKGVHPDSRGDNVNFKPDSLLPEGLVGSQTIRELALDANGNAAALPLATFFDTVVSEENGVRMRDMISVSHPALNGVFSQNEEQSQNCFHAFKKALDAEITKPATYELNKQLLWPLADGITADSYINLVPLHPVALTSAFLQKANDKRFSDENKAARDSRKKKDVSEHQPYISIRDLAYVRLGGTKPQNISQLTSRQGGRNVLLPSLPPQFAGKEVYRLNKTQQTLFTPRLKRCCQEGLQQLYSEVEAFKNVVETRDSRKQALDAIIAGIIAWAQHIQQTYPHGWSRDYELDWAEKYWLDPYRAGLEGEEDFAEKRLVGDWREEIVRRFALWLNESLKRKFPKDAHDFSENEYKEWQREFEDEIKTSLRSDMEVFV